MKQFISPLSTGYILIYTSDLLSNFICRWKQKYTIF
jgi:hypothetical protein